MQLTAGDVRARVLLGSQRQRGPFSSVAGHCAGPLSSPPYLPIGRSLLSPTLSSSGGKRRSMEARPFSRCCGQQRYEAALSFCSSARFATNWPWVFVRNCLRACFKNPPKRRVRARGLQERMRFRHPCRPGPLTGRFSKHALRPMSGPQDHSLPPKKETG